MGFASKNAHSEPKFSARNWIREKYRKFCGNFSLPKDKVYCSLSNYQAPFGYPSQYPSEVVQQYQAGLMTIEQYFGIDCGVWDKENKVWKDDIIRQNKIWHPTAQWRHGKWLEILENEPGLLKKIGIGHIDTTSHADGKAAEYTYKTASLISEPGTLLATTAMLNDSYSRLQFDPDMLVNQFHNKVHNADEWHVEVPRIRYSCAGKVDMMVCLFFKHS